MKVKAQLNCTGQGYKDFKKDEVRNLPKKLGELLIKFGYVKSLEKDKK